MTHQDLVNKVAELEEFINAVNVKVHRLAHYVTELEENGYGRGDTASDV